LWRLTATTEGDEMNKYLTTTLAIAAAAVLTAGTAAAAAPSRSTNTLHLAPFTDTDTCSFPITMTVDGTRTITTFDNGDVKRHVDLTVVQTANGHTAIETDVWNVFIDGTDPSAWTLTGRFGQIFLDGRLVYLQSGLIGFDPFTGELTDPHPGPAGTYPDACTLLAGS
jgi:hypothetical protein